MHECVGLETQPQPRRDLGEQSDWRVREGLCVGGKQRGKQPSFRAPHSSQVSPPFILGKPCDSSDLVAKSRATLLRPHGQEPARLLCSWEFPGKNSTGLGCHFLLWSPL